MRIGVLRETAPNERRVALVPPTVQRLKAASHDVLVEPGAGESAGFADSAYEIAGARLTERRTVLGESEIILAVQCPDAEDLASVPPGAVIIGLAQRSGANRFLAAAAAGHLTVLAMERVPRITKAQSMDALSSQATVAGYEAVLLGASHLARLLPMLTTAAGTIPPGRALVLGAGVAGLQAIATARRLGAIVSAFDVRPAVREQVQSLGATFVEAEAVSTSAEGTGGYAKELSEEQNRKVLEAIAKQLPDKDLVVTTAQIPGKPAPRLLTDAMVASMRAGSVIVDLAVESGGNCELSRPGETLVAHGVTIIGPLNLPSRIPQHASVMYSRNLQALLEYLIQDGRLEIDRDDPIAGPMCLVHGGDTAGV
jgi:proton-translocating NAD(P)+ transhydrogenase subunit alpha